MTTLFGSLLAVVLLGQAQPEPGRTVAGTVVDEEGKPIAGATVELPLPASPYLTRDPAPGRAMTLTDGDGRFELKLPPGRTSSAPKLYLGLSTGAGRHLREGADWGFEVA